MTATTAPERIDRVISSTRGTVKRLLRHAAASVGRLRTPVDERIPRILCYHGVFDRPTDEWSVTSDQLRAHMELLQRAYVPTPVEDIVAWNSGHAELSPRAVAVTFDDGFVDVIERAAPIMAEYGVPGAAFVPATLIGGGATDAGYQPSRPFMQWSQVRELASRGWTIGSHSLDHAALSRLDEDAARRQLVDSRDILEDELQQPVELLAYPYGTRGTVSIRDRGLAAAAGYTAAFMAMTGAMVRGSDRWALPRAKVLGTDTMAVVRQSLTGGMDMWRYVEGMH